MKAGFLTCDGQRTDYSVQYTEYVWERLRGLLWSPPLPERGALWIAPCNSIHTCFMSYPIDVVFLSRSGVVNKIKQGLSPWSWTSCWGAVAALELRAGSASLLGLVVGSSLGVAFDEAENNVESLP